MFLRGGLSDMRLRHVTQFAGYRRYHAGCVVANQSHRRVEIVSAYEFLQSATSRAAGLRRVCCRGRHDLCGPRSGLGRSALGPAGHAGHAGAGGAVYLRGLFELPTGRRAPDPARRAAVRPGRRDHRRERACRLLERARLARPVLVDAVHRAAGRLPARARPAGELHPPDGGRWTDGAHRKPGHGGSPGDHAGGHATQGGRADPRDRTYGTRRRDASGACRAVASPVPRATRPSCGSRSPNADLRPTCCVGENARRRLRHTAVARRLERVAPLPAVMPETYDTRIRVALEPTWNRDQLRVVAFIQEAASRRVIGAAQAPLAP